MVPGGHAQVSNKFQISLLIIDRSIRHSRWYLADSSKPRRVGMFPLDTGSINGLRGPVVCRYSSAVDVYCYLHTWYMDSIY